MFCPVKNLFSFFLKCTFAKRNEFFWKRQAKPDYLPEKKPFSQPGNMKFGKLKFGTFINRSSSASPAAVWGNETSCFSARAEGLWGYSPFPLQKCSRHVSVGKRRMALGWEQLLTPDFSQSIAGGQHRYLSIVVNKPGIEAIKGKKKVYWPTCRFSSQWPRLWMHFKRWWHCDQVVGHLSLALRQAWGSHKKTLPYVSKRYLKKEIAVKRE